MSVVRRYASGYIDDFGGNDFIQFNGLGSVKIIIWRVYGALLPGVYIESNLGGERQRLILGEESFEYSIDTKEHVYWTFNIVQNGADNVRIGYRIEYEVYEDL